MKVNRFLCGVDGVRDPGASIEFPLVGGVREEVAPLICVECDDGGRVGSGDRVGGVCWGIAESKISDLSNVENVRFASSAAIT